jgi:hypothetical protein
MISGPVSEHLITCRDEPSARAVGVTINRHRRLLPYPQSDALLANLPGTQGTGHGLWCTTALPLDYFWRGSLESALVQSFLLPPPGKATIAGVVCNPSAIGHYSLRTRMRISALHLAPGSVIATPTTTVALAKQHRGRGGSNVICMEGASSGARPLVFLLNASCRCNLHLMTLRTPRRSFVLP